MEWNRKPLERLEIFPELPDEFLEKIQNLKEKSQRVQQSSQGLSCCLCDKEKKEQEKTKVSNDTHVGVVFRAELSTLTFPLYF